MTEISDVSESIIQPVITAMIQSQGMEEDRRAAYVADALASAINGSEYFMIHRECLERLNDAMIAMHALLRWQQEELLRLAVDGADVDDDLLQAPDTLQ